ncbi:MAG: C40 family peptidase [Giesbergeria sp.]|uniref:C40 family peptidase n=1 Tax=Giesbergeria sp. TaxID=2818473 RepID=UPI00262CA48B|nr:C40 family peptidase [Giesbergeria sp.]MDD2610042.1 C40 family peptidase [Giesbergeria sp.]
MCGQRLGVAVGRWAGPALALALAACSSAPPVSSPSLARPPASSAQGGRLSSEMAHDIAIHALGLVGTPYRYGGNTPDGGFDCSGLIGYVYRARTTQAPPRTVAQLAQWGQQVPREQRRTGDLVLFGQGQQPTHAGIYVGQGRFVHAPSSGGKVRLDHLQARYWAAQQVAFLRP